jgi:aryl-alcohol dehydrogenase-like predicted oxidoreductase
MLLELNWSSDMPNPGALASYRLLGRSGLRVSPLALGTMTFGADLGWGSNESETARIFNFYLEQGGNFIDTANQYTNGTSERLIGKLCAGRRDSLVIATKYTLPTDAGNVNSGGNHRKSMVRSVETSLRRLSTDYIDLLYMHDWDAATPVEEILRAMDDLVRAGKVLYLGISNTMAWQISRMQAIAELRGWSPLVALQIEYNLLERRAEQDLVPMAREMGLGVIPWSPLASGVLTGKYLDDNGGWRSSQVESLRNASQIGSEARSERGIEIVRVVRRLAQELGKTPSQVSLAWLLTKPGVVAPIIGARTLTQLGENLRSIELQLPKTHLDSLEEASSIGPGFPHAYLQWFMKSAYMGCSMRIDEPSS